MKATTIPRSARFWLACIAAVLALGFYAVISMAPAHAADKGGPKSDTFLPPAASGWSGCGVGVDAGLVNADAGLGGPINIGANGQKAGIGVFCDRAFDRFVFGLFADYDWAFGNVHTVGANSDITVGGRAGILITQSVLAYALAAWSRVDLSNSLDHINGIKVGGGVEVKLPGAPFFVGLEYTKATYSGVGGSSIDINSDEVMLRLRYKFATGQ